MLARLSAWTASVLLGVITATLLLAAQERWMRLSSMDRCYYSGADLTLINLAYGIVVGLPLALAMYRFRWTHPLAMLIAGVALALPITRLEDPQPVLFGMAAAGVFWATLKSCGALTAGQVLARPRLSMALAGLSLLVTGLGVWANPICFIGF